MGGKRVGGETFTIRPKDNFIDKINAFDSKFDKFLAIMSKLVLNPLQRGACIPPRYS